MVAESCHKPRELETRNRVNIHSLQRVMQGLKPTLTVSACRDAAGCQFRLKMSCRGACERSRVRQPRRRRSTSPMMSQRNPRTRMLTRFNNLSTNMAHLLHIGSGSSVETVR
jgi:hypothetical protein